MVKHRAQQARHYIRFAGGIAICKHNAGVQPIPGNRIRNEFAFAMFTGILSRMILPTRTALTSAVIAEIVRRTVDALDPEKIVLFGSAARDEMGPHSDVDLMIVKAGNFNRRQAAVQLRRRLRGMKEAFDIIVAKPQDLERYGDSKGLVYYPALRDGRVIYES